MYYAICKSNSGPNNYNGYNFWMFKTLQQAHESELIDHKSIVYDGKRPTVLLETLGVNKLQKLWDKFGRPMSFVNQNQLVEYLHDLVDNKALLWTPDMENTMSEVEAKKRTRLNNNARIVRLVDAPNLREGTNRYRNMQVILGCATVGEAMEKLRALQPSPGGGVDIQLAVKAGAIKLEE